MCLIKKVVLKLLLKEKTIKLENIIGKFKNTILVMLFTKPKNSFAYVTPKL